MRTLAFRNLFHIFPVVANLGARQAGKTTLASMVSGTIDGDTHRFDLEDPTDLARLADPMHSALHDLEPPA